MFTDTTVQLEEGLKRGLLIGVNGISTFTKDESQEKMFAQVHLINYSLKKVAPFLTPVPFRGKVKSQRFVRNVAEHHAQIRAISLEEIAAATTAKRDALFALN